MTETKPKKKMGRPKLPAEKRAAAVVALRLSHADKALLTEAAEISQLSTSKFILQVARERALELVKTKSG